MTISRAEAARRAAERLDMARSTGEQWSPDFFPYGRDRLLEHLAGTGRQGEYGDDFEDLADPCAVHVPGCSERSVAALLAAITDVGLTVVPDVRPGKPPLFALGGKRATAGLVELRGVALALVVDYVASGRQVPVELTYAATRISASGTHSAGVAHALAGALRRAERARD
ncbi:hypothetical protein ABH931_003115 [Streptacidiphilus sp. MAP12-33]|uniref:hypothetical protein n=1 Tax=Streptacidiphilus sp. MAP12-33 TaxID=3156266 RepID=UPI0035135AD1